MNTSATTDGDVYMRKPNKKLTIWQKMYDKDNNLYFGRTPKSLGMYLIVVLCFFFFLEASQS